MVVLSEEILYVIMYAWSRREPDAQVSFFGFKFKSLYMPWFYVALRLLMGGSVFEPLVGIAVGHLYYFLIQILPISHGYNLIKTPKFCLDIISYATGAGYQMPPTPARVPVAPGAAQAGPQVQAFPRMGTGYNWGRGRTLGAN